MYMHPEDLELFSLCSVLIVWLSKGPMLWHLSLSSPVLKVWSSDQQQLHLGTFWKYKFLGSSPGLESETLEVLPAIWVLASPPVTQCR